MSRKVQQTKTPELSFFRRELLAILFFGTGIFLYLSLFSYHPQDPSFSSLSSSFLIHNWGGVLGAYLADSLLLLFGGGSYFFGLFFLIIGFHFLVGTRSKFSFYELPLFSLFLILTSVFFELTFSQLRFGNTWLEAGGIVGGALSSQGIALLGRPGTYLLVTFGALITLVWATRLSVLTLGSFVTSHVSQSFSWGLQKIRIYTARFTKSFGQWWHKVPAKPVLPKREIAITQNSGNVFVRQEETKLLQKPESKIVPVNPIEGPRILARTEPKKNPAVETKQMVLPPMGKGYQLPPLTLLDAEHTKPIVVDNDGLKANARLLERKFLDFGIEGNVTEIHPGPVITMYEFQPAPGVKLSRIAGLVDDLSLAMEGRSVRIVAPLPSKAAVGIEIPNNERETVYLKDIIADEKFQKSDSKIPIALGKDIEGIPYVADLSKMPHLLMAGATGAGKSVSINATILSFLYKSSPEDVRIIMVDPKMLELSIYEGIPHLLLPVVTDPKKANLALRWAVREMERRYKLLSDINARNIINYNQKLEKNNYVSRQQEKIKEMGSAAYLEEGEMVKHEGKIPYIVIIIDELADLMMVAGRDVEESITRLAQMARAAGIHLILATQRPSVDVLTGVIKANFPARITFKVSAKHDSRTIIDAIGAERLLGNGDMLFVPPNASKMVRVHGAYISETEVTRVVENLKQQGRPVYDETILKPIEAEAENGMEGGVDEDTDALYDQAVAIVSDTKQASISMIQRKLRVGYNRAARMIEKMESQGIVSPPSGTGHRQVLTSSFGAADLG